MVGGIETIGASSGVGLPQASAVPVAVHQPSANFAASVAASSGAPAAPVLAANPRVVQDPSAGFITQYLSANGGQVVSQSPSVITVAYLRLGLTAEGTAKVPSYESFGTTA